MIQLKNMTQIIAMRDAGRITGEALAYAGEHVKPGVTTKHLDDLVRSYIEKQHARPSFLGYGGFPGSACISVNDEVIHGIPDKDRELHDGDVVKIDVGASSYYSEIASLQTLDNLLLNGHINVVQYLERIPDGNVAGRRKLIDEIKQQMEEQQRMAAQQAMMEQQMAMEQQAAAATPEVAESEAAEEKKSTGFKELGEALRAVERSQQ